MQMEKEAKKCEQLQKQFEADATKAMRDNKRVSKQLSSFLRANFFAIFLLW